MAAEPHAAPAQIDAGHSSAAFVLKGGDIFGVGKQNLLVDAGHVIAVGVAALTSTTRSAASSSAPAYSAVFAII